MRERDGRTGQLSDYGRHTRNARMLAWGLASTLAIGCILLFTQYSIGWLWWISAFGFLAWSVALARAQRTCAVCGCGHYEISSVRQAERQKEEREYHPRYEVISTTHDNNGSKISETRRDTGYWTSTHWTELNLKYSHKCKQCGHAWDGGTKWRRKTDSEQREDEAKEKQSRQEQEAVESLKTKRNLNAGYKAVPFLPESNASMLARFAAALSPLPRHPTREHIFDFENNVRMIVSKETKPGAGALVHISFRISPNHGNTKVDFDLQNFALQTAGTFVTLPEVFSTPQTGKVIHLFYKA